jgi:hypothetical protein
MKIGRLPSLDFLPPSERKGQRGRNKWKIKNGKLKMKR